MPPHRKKAVEDPDNTWNMQLMAAVLAFDLPLCQDLVAKGADPVKAREPTPFTSGGRVSPLAALILQGTLSAEALAVAKYLMECGASLEEVMPLPELSAPLLTVSDAASNEEVGKGGGKQRPTSGERPQRSPNRAPGKADAASAAAVASGGVAPTAPSLSPPVMPQARLTQKEIEALVATADNGTLLHYVVALGDHAHLLQLLMVLGEQTRAAPPQSLLSAVETEMAIQPAPQTASVGQESAMKAVGAGGRPVSPSRPGSRGSRSRSRAASLSRRQSREKKSQQQQQQHEAELVAAAAAARKPLVPSPLPTLTQYPFESLAEASTTSSTTVLSRTPIRLLPCAPSGKEEARPRGTLDLEKRTTKSQCTALELAVSKKDILAIRLLTYYGAKGFSVNPFPYAAEATDAGEHEQNGPSIPACVNGYVNGLETLLARACSKGDIAAMEALLDSGDSLSQLSFDGRYTLMHYAVGQPLALQYLVRRGLSGDVENAFGETTLVSLIRHGTGRNADYACKEAPCVTDAPKLAALPPCVLRNYILTPLPPLVMTGKAGKDGGGGSASRAPASGGSRSPGRPGNGHAQQQLTPRELAVEYAKQHAERNVIGGGQETGTWFAFTSLPTAELIENILIHSGASINGFVPDDELDLAYVEFAENVERGGVQSNNNNARTGYDAVPGQGANFSHPSFAPKEAGSPNANGGKKKGGSTRGGASRSPSPSTFVASTQKSARAVGSSNNSVLYKVSDATMSEFNDADSIIAGSLLNDSHLERSSANAIFSTLQKHTGGIQPARLPLRATPLMHAIYNYHPELIRKFVVDYRADVMGRDSQGACALHYAAQSPHVSVLDFLLSPLVLGLVAAQSGSGPHQSAASSAQNSGSSAPVGIDVNVSDMAGRTPLHYAAAIGNAPAMKRLLTIGATVQAGKPDCTGRTPLHLAVLANSAECVEALLRHSKTVMPALCGVVNGASNSNSMFATGAASGNANNQLASKRGAPGASPSHSHLPGGAGRNRRGSALGTTARGGGGGGSGNDNYAAGALGVSVNEWVVVDTESVDEVDRATPLEMAVKKRANPQIVRLLMSEGGASYHRPSGLLNGGSLLHKAVMEDDLACVTLLLEHYADPNEVDDNDDTPLVLALDRPSDKVNVAVVEKLLRLGALPNAQSGTTLRTPLHIAAERGHSKDVLSLLFFELGAERGGLDSPSSHPGTGGGSAREARGSSLSSASLFAAESGRSPNGSNNRGAGGGAVARRLKERLLAGRKASLGSLPVEGKEGVAPREVAAPAELSADAYQAKIRARDIARGRFSLRCSQLIPEPHFFLTDSKGRTPFQLLCGHTDPVKQENAMQLLQAIVGDRDGAMRWASPDEAAATAHIGARGHAADSFATSTLTASSSPFVQKLCFWTDAKGRLPLHDACHALFADAVKLLLAAAPSTALWISGDNGGTALHEAVSASYFSSTGSLVGFASPSPSVDRQHETDGERDTERRKREAMDAVFSAVEQAVTSSLPAKLEGYSAQALRREAHRCNRNAMAHGSITSQLQNRASPFAKLAVNSVAQAGSQRSQEQPIIRSWRQYACLTDSQGRTAFLLAGERGDLAASGKLMKLCRPSSAGAAARLPA